MTRTFTAACTAHVSFALLLGLTACGSDEPASDSLGVTPPPTSGGLAGSSAPSVSKPSNDVPVSSSSASTPSAPSTPSTNPTPTPTPNEAPATATPSKPTANPTTTPDTGEGTSGFSEKCDEVYTIKAHGQGGVTSPYMVPAGQEIHPKISIPAPWGNEEVQMVAMRAISDNKKVLHHWILYGAQREFLVGWAPGKDKSAPLPPDVGMHMPGGNLTLDMHYYNVAGTQAEPDNSGLDICVVKKPNFRPNTATVNQTFSQFLINIPARATDFNVTGSCTFTGQNPATLLTASPHAHTMAKHMKFTVTKKSGEVIVMHDEDFDFNEQTSYPLAQPIKLENGDMVTTTCTYDNPTDRAVTFGENTGNEMCFNFAVYYPMGSMACGAGSFTGPGGR